MEKVRIAACLFTGLALWAVTVALPVFAAPPPFIALNVAGTMLVAYGLGPLAGALFGAFTHVALNSVGMGSGIIGFVALTRCVEGCIPALLDRPFRAVSLAWLSPFAGALALAALVKPLGTALSWLLSPYAGDSAFWSWFGEDMRFFMTHGLRSALAAYVFSCLVGWAGAGLLGRVFTPKNQSTFERLSPACPAEVDSPNDFEAGNSTRRQSMHTFLP